MTFERPISTSRADRPLAVVVMAAGLGTRMKSALPKMLHPVCGRPLLSYVLDAASGLAPQRVVVVTGPEHDEVAAILPAGAVRAVQPERRGSGDAVRAGMEQLGDFEGDVLVLNGVAAPVVPVSMFVQVVDGGYRIGMLGGGTRVSRVLALANTL